MVYTGGGQNQPRVLPNVNALLLAAALVTSASLLAWTGLVFARGGFWRTNLRLPLPPERDAEWPDVAVIIPARDEADVLPRSLPTLFRQDYPGRVRVFLVDDGSEDGTAAVAAGLAGEAGAADRLTVIPGEPLAPGWVGKVWALQQGVRAAREASPEFLLLTDADISHAPHSLRSLVSKALGGGFDLVSLMARLRVETLWDRLLLPAYVFFFAKLYPFRWSNDPNRSTAAAAGGCILLRLSALEQAGGLEPIASEMIDDCGLARRIKRHGSPHGGGRTWLGLTQDVHSLRSYRGISPLWDLVARTAFAQLRFSPLLLVGTVLGMLILYATPPLATIGGLVGAASSPGPLTLWLMAGGAAAWLLMAGSYLPMLRWYDVSPLFAFLLTLAGALYMLMTIASAVRWWRGRGGGWKGRTYDVPHTAT